MFASQHEPDHFPDESCHCPWSQLGVGHDSCHWLHPDLNFLVHSKRRLTFASRLFKRRRSAAAFMGLAPQSAEFLSTRSNWAGTLVGGALVRTWCLELETRQKTVGILIHWGARVCSVSTSGASSIIRLFASSVLSLLSIIWASQVPPFSLSNTSHSFDKLDEGESVCILYNIG